MGMNKQNKDAAQTIVGEICLYGNRETGAGWLASTLHGERFGTGEPVAERSFTEAIWMAANEIRKFYMQGLIRIYAAGGERMTTIKVCGHPPVFGDLKWELAIPAVVLTVKMFPGGIVSI
jgi:hypothetical protein